MTARLAVALAACLALPAAATTCPWFEPGAAPYGPSGDLGAAVHRLTHIPEQHRLVLVESLRLGTPSEVTRITSAGIQSKRFRSPRNMNFSGGRICWGEVDTAMWPATRSQIVQIHASGPWAVGYYPGCGNISELTDTAPRAEARIRNTVPEPSDLWLALIALACGGIVTYIQGRKP
jgi:hypothetical protein